ncbi:hypothetical protein [Rhodococcus opacus]|jgi:hypothetical protein|nr:hypothetical protein [Rhodococcus opacus]
MTLPQVIMNTMPQPHQHERQRDHRQNRRAETNTGVQILLG